MKNIKLMLSVFAAVMLMTATAFAQRPGQNIGRQVEMMAKQLDLSEVQIEQITAIQENFTAKFKDLRGTITDREVMKETMKKLNGEREEQIQSVLTKAQVDKWNILKKERKEVRGEGQRPDMERPKGERPGMERPKGERPDMERPKGERPTIERPKAERPEIERPKVERPQKPKGKKLDKLQTELGLSDAQMVEMKKITKTYGTKIKELKASGAKRKKIKAAKKVRKAAVKKVLTPEQYEKWLTMVAERKGKKRK